MSNPDWRWWWGTVTSTTPLRVRREGESVPLSISPVDAVPVGVGDKVWCQQRQGGQVYIVARKAGGATPLGNTEHLDSLTDTNVWNQSLTANASTARGYPVQTAGLLEVFKASSTGHMIHQRYSSYAGTAVYWRTYYNVTGWSPWKQIYPAPAPTPPYVPSDTGWKTLSIASPFRVYGSNPPPTYRVIEDIVYVNGILSTDTVGHLEGAVARTMFVLPAEARPIYDNIFRCSASSNNDYAINVNPAGQAGAGRYGPGSQGANVWLPFSFSFPRG